MVWGSDWPHTRDSNRPMSYRRTNLEPFCQEDDRRNFGLIRDWTSQANARERPLVANPAQLFGFDGPWRAAEVPRAPKPSCELKKAVE